MSDGNVNRKLIPTNQYQSGFRAGELRMKQRALQALEESLSENDAFTSIDKESLRMAFLQRLGGR